LCTDQPVPQQDVRSSAAWRALEKSHAGIVEPTIERWKGGLDAMLVFVSLFISLHIPQLPNNCSKSGLFSAIVTAFFIDSLSKLQPDDGAATNELLSNITNILLLVHGISFNETGLPALTPFEPDRNDVRENVFWSISLALSVSQLLA
jgi:hypothetical protein